MNLLLLIEQLAKHIMSASDLSLKLQAFIYTLGWRMLEPNRKCFGQMWDFTTWNSDFHCVKSHKNKWDVCSIKLIDSLAPKSNRVGMQSEEKMAKFSV